MSRLLNIFVPHCSSLLTDHQPHGDGLVAYGFLRHLGERGHHVYVAAEAVDLLHALPPNVAVTEIGSRGGVRDRIRYMRSMRTLYQTLSKTVRFDVVHQLNPVFTGMSLAIPRASAPLILGPYVASWPKDPDAAIGAHKSLRGVALWGRALIARIQQSRADALLLTTPAAADRIPSAETMRAKLHIVPHGLDTEFFSPRAGEIESVGSHQDVLFLSNLVERKGILDLIQAFGKVLSSVPQARLLIAGDGPELQRAKLQVDVSLAGDRVLFLGRQTREGSLHLLQQCDLFCQPSHGEPYGMSAAEAMSCAKPLVVTNAGGLSFLVDEEGGLRVPTQSPGELADALIALLADEGRRKSMGEHNRRRALQTMSWDRVIDKLESIYHAAMDQRSAATVSLQREQA